MVLLLWEARPRGDGFCFCGRPDLGAMVFAFVGGPTPGRWFLLLWEARPRGDGVGGWNAGGRGRPLACYRREGAPPTGFSAGFCPCFCPCPCRRPDLGAMVLLLWEARPRGDGFAFVGGPTPGRWFLLLWEARPRGDGVGGWNAGGRGRPSACYRRGGAPPTGFSAGFRPCFCPCPCRRPDPGAMVFAFVGGPTSGRWRWGLECRWPGQAGGLLSPRGRASYRVQRGVLPLLLPLPL